VQVVRKEEDVFANPVAPPKVLPQRDILRFLRLITSPAYRREPQRLPLSVVAAMCNVSRLALYRIIWLDRVSDEMAEVLTPIVRAYEAGKLRCRRSSPNGRYPNHWEIIE
jgi:hypothetical protein